MKTLYNNLSETLRKLLKIWLGEGGMAAKEGPVAPRIV